jgi:hypothetical protein
MSILSFCSAPKDTAGEVIDSQQAISVKIEPSGPPLWLQDAHEAQQKAEEEAKVRLAELVERRRVEEERKAQLETESQERKTDVEAESKAEPKAAPKKVSAKKVAAPKPAEGAPVLTMSTTAPAPTEQETKALVKEAVTAVNESHVKFDFEVKIESARNLRDADWLTGTSDPYCTLESLGTSKLKFRTKTVNDKENPVWNQKVKMSLNMHEDIKFTIWDQDVGKADDLLGWAKVSFKDIAGKGFDGELKLHDASDTMVPRDAFLKVCIKFVGSHAEAASAKAATPTPTAKAGAAVAKSKAAAKAKA